MGNINANKVRGAKFYYSQGFTVSTAKRICQYFLGDYFFKIQSNHNERRFECYIKNKITSKGKVIDIDKIEVNEFEKFWNIKCFIIDVTNI